MDNQLVAPIRPEPEVTKRTHYAALFYKDNDPNGEFEWGIVANGFNATNCIFFQLTLGPNWQIVSPNDGRWSPWTQPRLLCLVKIKKHRDTTDLDDAYDQLRDAGRDILRARTVSNGREGQPFNDRTWALDTIARAFPEWSGQGSLFFDTWARYAARQSLQDFMQLQGPQACLVPGLFNKYSLITAEDLPSGGGGGSSGQGSSSGQGRGESSGRSRGQSSHGRSGHHSSHHSGHHHSSRGHSSRGESSRGESSRGHSNRSHGSRHHH